MLTTRQSTPFCRFHRNDERFNPRSASPPFPVLPPPSPSVRETYGRRSRTDARRRGRAARRLDPHRPPRQDGGVRLPEARGLAGERYRGRTSTESRRGRSRAYRFGSRHRPRRSRAASGTCTAWGAGGQRRCGGTCVARRCSHHAPDRGAHRFADRRARRGRQGRPDLLGRPPVPGGSRVKERGQMSGAGSRSQRASHRERTRCSHRGSRLC
jgi:hypothetical protein